MFVWLLVEYAAYASLYDKTYRAAYSLAASGRLKLAEHIRHLSLGFFGKRDPGDLTNLILSDYGQVEHTICHNLSQLISAIVLPVLAFGGLLLVDWRMAVAMFIAVPLGVAMLWLTDSIQARLSENHVRAKNEAASRLQEYLSGIREIKAHNMGGKRFERLRRSFDELKSASIRLEGIMGPTIALPYSYYDWRERLTFLADTFGEESKKDEYLAKYDAKSAEWKQKLEAAVHGESFAVIETYPNNLVIYSNKGAAEMLYGEWGLKS